MKNFLNTQQTDSIPSFKIGTAVVVEHFNQTLTGYVTHIVQTNAGLLYRVDGRAVLLTASKMRLAGADEYEIYAQVKSDKKPEVYHGIRL